MDSFIHSFIHSFIYQIFKCSLHARPCSDQGGMALSERDVSSLLGSSKNQVKKVHRKSQIAEEENKATLLQTYSGFCSESWEQSVTYTLRCCLQQTVSTTELKPECRAEGGTAESPEGGHSSWCHKDDGGDQEKLSHSV